MGADADFVVLTPELEINGWLPAENGWNRQNLRGSYVQRDVQFFREHFGESKGLQAKYRPSKFDGGNPAAAIIDARKTNTSASSELSILTSWKAMPRSFRKSLVRQQSGQHRVPVNGDFFHAGQLFLAGIACFPRGNMQANQGLFVSQAGARPIHFPAGLIEAA